MVTPKVADLAFEIEGGHVMANKTPGLGVAPRLDVLGKPVQTYE